MTHEQLKVRKLRKKIRQIENLERLDRDLNEEEKIKVSKKASLRVLLLDLLSQLTLEGNSSVDSLPTSEWDTSHDNSYPSFDDHFQPVDGPSNGYHGDTASQGYHRDEDEHSSVSSEEEEAVENTPAKAVPQKRPLEEHLHDDLGPLPDMKENAPPKKRKEQQHQQLQHPAQDVRTEGKTKDGKKKGKSDQQKEWRKSQFCVREFTGHNDLVNCVDMDEVIMVTGSRDTTVRVWEIGTGIEVRSMGGHTMSVTSVRLLSQQQTNTLLERFETDVKHSRLVVSASHDCHIKLWSTSTGEQMLSMYTYNPVLCLTYVTQEALIISGSDGGKLEVWDASAGQQVQSIRAQEEAITAIQFDNTYVYCSSLDGLIKTYTLRERQLHLIFVSENVKLVTGQPLLCRPIHSIATDNDVVYYGDDGMNVKVMHWKQGSVHKLGNHLAEFGSTDAVCICGGLFLASGYDLDNGIGYVNVRTLPDEKYVASLCDEDTSRIVSIAASKKQDGRLCLATAGVELKVWIQLPSNTDDDDTSGEDVFGTHYISQYDRTPRNSDIDSESEWSESDDEVTIGGATAMVSPFRRRGNEEVEDQTTGWWSWCTLL